MQKQLEESDQRMHALESKHMEELKQLEKKHVDSEGRSHAVIAEQKDQLQMYKTELAQKNQSLRRLEDDCSRLRVGAGQHESKVDAMASEITELHGAVASLHGELSALQRELEDAQRDAKTAQQSLNSLQKTSSSNLEELEELRRDKEQSERDFAKLEQRLADTTAKLNSLSYETTSRIEGLVAERESLQTALLKKEVKLKQQVTTNQELNTHLGKVHADAMGIKEEYSKLEEGSTKRVNFLSEELVKLRNNLQTSEELNARLTSQLASAKKESSQLLQELKSQESQIESMTADSRKLVKRVDRVETEKADILMELSHRSTVTKELQNALDGLQEKYTSATERCEKEKYLYRELETNFRNKEAEIRQLQIQLADRDERTVALERQLHEETTLKENAIEANRAQQKDSANRIVECTQKNSKISGELNNVQEELFLLKGKAEEMGCRLRNCEVERDEWKCKHSVANKRVQELEDTVEMDLARLEASESEINDLKQAVKAACEKAVIVKAEMLEAHQQELQELKVTHQGAIKSLEEAAVAAKKNSDSILEKSLAKARETFQRQLEEIQVARQREASEARSRLSTLGSAMEGLQRELRGESSKNTSLIEEVSVLRDLVESGGGEAEKRLKHVEKERGKEKQRLETALADTKEQLNSAKEAVAQLHHQVTALRQELSAERELKVSTDQALKLVKEKLHSMEGSSESASNEMESLKQQLKDTERRFTAQLATKDQEIQRVTRRNEVLSEAVSRLTHMSSSGGTPSGNGEVGYGFNACSAGHMVSYDYHHQARETAETEYGGSSSARGQPVPSTPGSMNGLGADPLAFQATDITAPPPDPFKSSNGVSLLRSNSATIRTPTRKENTERAVSANGLKLSNSYASHHHQKASIVSPRGSNSPSATPSSPLGRPVEDVSSSLARVQRALASRRSSSSTRGGPRSALSNNGPELNSPRGSLGSGLSLQRDRHGHCTTTVSESEGHGYIKAEYDAAYAQSSHSVLKDELFSPSRKRETVSYSTPPVSEYYHAPRDIEYDSGEGAADHTSPPSSNHSRVPQLDIRKRNSKGNTETFDVDSGRGGISNRTTESTSSRESAGSYSRRIRDAVEMGKESQLEFSPSRIGNAENKRRAGSSSGGSQTERLHSDESRKQRGQAVKRTYSAPPEKVNLSHVVKASRDKTCKKET